ncbi:MAG: hypothetical protein ABIZ04_07955 [Opitutus sp.]
MSAESVEPARPAYPAPPATPLRENENRHETERLLPQIVERKSWHFVFPHRATFLKALLLLRGGPRIVLITTPWYFDDARSDLDAPAPPHVTDQVIARVEK